MARHSPIGFSGAERWLTCPGSVRLSKGLARSSSEYADEGTVAHAVAEHCFKENIRCASLRGKFAHVVTYDTGDLLRLTDSDVMPPDMLAADVTPERVITRLIDGEMSSGVDLYRDTVLKDSEPGDELEHEVRFHIPQIHPDLFGMADTANYRERTAFLRVYDFKYGAGVQVEVEENEQVMGYALGAALRMHNRGLHDVELVIVQPRAPHVDGPVRRWSFKAIELLDWAHIYQEGAQRTDDPNAPFVPGDHCRWCPAAGICATLREEVELAMLDEFPKDTRPNLERLNDARKRVPAVKAWCKAVENLAIAEALAGRVCPDFKIVDKRAVRTWKDEDEARRALLGNGAAEAEIIEPAALKSPAQVETIVGKAEFEAIAGDYVAAVSSGKTLAPLSDNRPAIVYDPKAGFEDVTAKQTDLVDQVAAYNDVMGLKPAAPKAKVPSGDAVTDEQLLDIPAFLKRPDRPAEINPLD